MKGNTKRCPDCGRDLPLTRFYVNNARADGLTLYCKECAEVRFKNSRKKVLKIAQQYRERHPIDIMHADSFDLIRAGEHRSYEAQMLLKSMQKQEVTA